MMRLLGAILVLGAALWFGFSLAMKEKYRLQELEELERGLVCLQGQIRYLSAPLKDALETAGWKMRGQAGQIFQKAAEEMAKGNGETAESIWCEVWKNQGKQTFFSSEDVDAIMMFGRSLGYLDKTQQENSITLFLRYIEHAREQGKRRLEKNGRLYYSVGGLTGLLMVVTLL